MALENLKKERLKKLKNIQNLGIDPYPASVKTSAGKPANRISTDSARKLIGKKVFVAGRLRSLRPHGKITFADLEDESGKIQLFLSQEELPDKYDFLSNLDLGDFIQAEGEVFKTQAGEITVRVSSYELLTKSIRPLPSTWYGLKDTEERLRKRYLDLLINPEVRELFRLKSKFWAGMRKYLIDRGFLEVEAGVLEAIPGGADARPFITHMNALDIDLYLRISLELPLKRLLVGGYEKVFEIGRIFRNEGIDEEHLQDYTQLEFYWAYADYNQLMDLTKDMYQTVIKETFGTLKTKWHGITIDWSGDWPKVEYTKLLDEHWGVETDKMFAEDLYKLAKKLKVDVEPNLGKGRLLDHLYKKTIRPKLIQPMFVINHPVEVEPLAKRLEKDPSKVQRMQVLAMGTELGKGFSELNDPIDQRERFEEQMKLRAAGDEEAQMMDEDYVEAMEYGMPPNAGLGVSERLFAMLVDKPIRETTLFPLMKPESIKKARKQDFEKKFVVVLNNKMKSWELTNTVGHITAYLAHKMDAPFDTGKYFETKDGKLYPRNSQYPVVSLVANDKQLKELVGKLRNTNLLYIAYLPEMITLGDDKKLAEAIGSKNDEEIEYCGVGIFGGKIQIDDLIKGFELWK